MDIYSAFPSNYLKASDLQGRNARVTIEDVKVEKVGDDERPVAYFVGKTKGLVLNKTNANTIADMFGGNTDEWVAREITLYPTKTDYQGKRVDAIRVQYVDPRQQQRQTSPATPAAVAAVAAGRAQPARHDERNPPPADDMNDEVPW